MVWRSQSFNGDGVDDDDGDNGGDDEYDNDSDADGVEKAKAQVFL